MAVANSLAKTQKTGMAAYLTQDEVKKQINSVVGGKNGTRFISSIVYLQCKPHRNCRSALIRASCQQHFLVRH